MTFASVTSHRLRRNGQVDEAGEEDTFDSTTGAEQVEYLSEYTVIHNGQIFILTWR